MPLFYLSFLQLHYHIAYWCTLCYYNARFISAYMILHTMHMFTSVVLVDITCFSFSLVIVFNVNFNLYCFSISYSINANFNLIWGCGITLIVILVVCYNTSQM